MPRSNRPVTLKDLHGGIESGRNDSDTGSTKVTRGDHNNSRFNTLESTFAQKYATNSSFVPPKVCHIPTLAKAEQALEMLRRVVREFMPIIQRRCYNVVSISELCCCNDGLDFEPNRRRKLHKMSNNIWGYNRTTWSGGKKSHTIHLRLRHPNKSNHESRLHVYEDVAGTLAHELAHCEYGPHNKQFYKLMDDILEEHASLMSSNLSLGADSMPAFGGVGHTLGTGTNGNSSSSARTARIQALDGQKLGGDSQFQQWMTPREAAVAAAMARHRQQQMRLRGNRCCRPCTINRSQSGESSDEEEVVVIQTDPTLGDLRPAKKMDMEGTKKSRAQYDGEQPNPQPVKRKRPGLKSVPKVQKNAGAPSKQPSLSSVEVIDLTIDDENIINNGVHWNCSRCTFRNKPIDSICNMCSHPR